MAQSPVSGKYRWIQLNTEVAVNNWKYKPVKDSYSHSSDPKQWGYETKIRFEPKLTIDDHTSYLVHRGSNGWVYFHEKVALNICLNFSDKTNYAGLRVCYSPKSTQSTYAFLQEKSQFSGSCFGPTIQSSYVWIFDICLIKMMFSCQNDPTRTITKNFHLDSSSGKCKSEDHSSNDEFAHFENSEFLSKLDVESLIGHQLEFGETSFLPVEFKIRFRLSLCPLSKDNEMMNADAKCKLNSSEKIQPIYSDKVSVSAMLLSKNKAKTTLFHMDFDVTFEIKAGSEQATVLKAHSWVLVAQSPVFFKMLTTDMLEKKQGIIKMEHRTTAESLALFLTCLYDRMGLSYSENPENREFKSLDEWTPEISFQTLQLAHKYQVKDLTDFCIENIISRPDSEFTTELAVKLFKAGMLYETDDLRQRSIEWIKRRTSELVKAELKELLKEESPDVATSIFLSLF